MTTKPRTRKFAKGPPIASASGLIIALEADGWVFYRERPIDDQFINNMTLGVIRLGLKYGLFHVACKGERK